MQLETEVRGDDLLVVVAADRIDAMVAVQFKDAMRQTTDGGPARVVLDLSRVGFLDSSGLGALVAAMKALGPDRRLDLLAPTPAVEKVFRLTRMNTVFAIHPDEAAAFEEKTRDHGAIADAS
jgi:anti-sigma B factor antagonist